MEIRYRREDVAKMLGLTAEEMAQADARPELAFLGGTPEVYGPEHISAYRKVLGLYPPRRSQRRQLFLNFKGGTGKTSLSVAYAYRMAEFGYRVLLIDLDSQGHATQTWGSTANSANVRSTTSWCTASPSKRSCSTRHSTSST